MNRDEEKHRMGLIANGDKKAFEDLYQLTSKNVFYYLQRFLQSRESAEDILIEVYAQVWQKAGNYKGKSKVTTWIFGIARNLALNELRKTGNKPMQPLPDTVEDTRGRSVFTAFKRRQHIQKALLSLSLKHREIIDLVFFHEMLYSEIAQLLDVSENTVKTRMFYAKAALKEQLLRLER